jgi:hypothetical protein
MRVHPKRRRPLISAAFSISTLPSEGPCYRFYQNL